MSIELLTEHHLQFLSIKGDCTGSSESTLVKMSHCWKSRDAAQRMMIYCTDKSQTKDPDRIHRRATNFPPAIQWHIGGGPLVVHRCLEAFSFELLRTI